MSPNDSTAQGLATMASAGFEFASTPEQVAHDVRTMWEHLGRPALPVQPCGLHDALEDARHVKVRFEALAERAYRLGLSV